MDKTKRKAVKGTAYYYDDDSMEFVRQGKGREVQKDVRKHRGSKMYRTVGEKQSSLHWTAPTHGRRWQRTSRSWHSRSKCH